MSTLISYSKKSNAQLSDHFNIKEFECPCDSCKLTLIDKVLVSQLEAMRTLMGSKLRVTSGYRCADYQNQLRLKGYDTAKGISMHELGQAADVTNDITPGHELEDMARKADFTSIGVGKLWIHVDLRPGHRRWTYKY